ncbi:ribonuclease HI family protein [Massilia endophytica]|uniref:ribonuclease HI family protein n=1 Tax=Massilia endophytica TaxID=2899220 RepID=UPI001E416A5D|nr:ribonuclease HI family protein [Massilia endophytica]UGQ48301.1 ribonuclease HI family protein [Massilia endophytica]
MKKPAPSPTAWRGWFDGSAHPNPGRLGIGAVLRGPAGEHVEISERAGQGSSSDAEYLALIALLEAAAARGVRELQVAGDSQVVVQDVLMEEEFSAPVLAEHRAKAVSLIAAMGNVALRWVPRHRNGEADSLSQRAAAQ